MATTITDRLRTAFIANGGTEEGFNARKDLLLSQYREQATIQAALNDANQPPDMNQMLRDQIREARAKNTIDVTLDVHDLNKKGA